MSAVSPFAPPLARVAVTRPHAHAGTLAAGDLARRPAPHVLVIADPSPAGRNAAWRGALVARDRGLRLHLLALRATPAGLQSARAALDATAAEIRSLLQIRVSADALAGGLAREGMEAAAGADLLVIEAEPRRRLADLLLGSRAERLVRLCPAPILVVRRPALGSYRRVLVPVELDAEAPRLIATALAFSRDPAMQVLHVAATSHEETLRLADVPEHVIQRGREGTAARGRAQLSELIRAAHADRHGATPAIAFGHAPSQVLEHALRAGAELLVLGKRRRHALAELFRGGVTRRIFHAPRTDVLLVPLP